MIPIKEGCKALIINCNGASGEVTVGKCHDKKASNGAPIWGIDKNIPWFSKQDSHKTLLPFCPEDKLMRIDGFENKQTSEHEIMERVMAK